MTTQSERRQEARLLIEGQWFYRGNLSHAWFACQRDPAGPLGAGKMDRVEASFWLVFERTWALEQRVAAFQAEQALYLEGQEQSARDMAAWIKRAETLEQRVAELEKQLKGYRAHERSINEALNSGDGSYRP